MINEFLPISQLSMSYLLIIFIVIASVELALLYNMFAKYSRFFKYFKIILKKLDSVEEKLNYLEEEVKSCKTVKDNFNKLVNN